MLEAKYYKDYNHNYMILEGRDIGEGEIYQRRMLTLNKIEGILKCSIRDINGDVYFYYDISSKVSVENLYKGKVFSYEQTRDLLIQLNIIYKNLSQFFMDESSLLLRPDCIYYDLTSEKYYGLYYPDKENSAGNMYEELMDFLLSHIDANNQKLVDNMYRIYEMLESNNFMLGDALQIFDETENDIPDVRNFIEENVSKGKLDNGSINNLESTMPIYINDESNINSVDDIEEYSFLSEEAGYDMEKNSRQSRIKTKEYSKMQTKYKSNSKFYSIFAIISLCGMSAAGWIYFNYKLTQKELMMIVCCLIFMGVCFVFSIIQFKLSGKRTKEKVKEETELKQDIENEFRDERLIPVEEILDKNMGMFPEHKAVDKRYGETVFIDIHKQKTEYKLYALDRKNKKHIELTQFPFTIGKMAGCVDCVLMDDSISRLHARIEKEDEKVLLTDMNSTNGTYKNGLRMEPSETVELEPGDEIRFGKLSYCYR